MERRLIQILDEHRSKYNTMRIQTNLDIIKREAILKSIEEYYKLKKLDDEELRDKLSSIALDLRMRINSLDKSTEKYFVLSCELQYWYEITDAMKSVRIVGEK